jgi:hypothetical protein
VSSEAGRSEVFGTAPSISLGCVRTGGLLPQTVLGRVGNGSWIKKGLRNVVLALHNRPITLGGSGQIASDGACPAPATLCYQERGAAIAVFWLTTRYETRRVTPWRSEFVVNNGDERLFWPQNGHNCLGRCSARDAFRELVNSTGLRRDDGLGAGGVVVFNEVDSAADLAAVHLRRVEGLKQEAGR